MLKVLGIDDLRPLHQCGLIARNYKLGIEALTKLGPWDILYLDHDLGDMENKPELTGYDIARFIELNPEYCPKVVRIVSSNPVGRERIKQALAKLPCKVE